MRTPPHDWKFCVCCAETSLSEAWKTMSTKIGRFEILAEISRSFNGSVNKASDSAGGQVVALKVVDLKPFGDQAPTLVKRILAEAENSKLLNTHNIAMLFGAGEIDGQFCATMEYVQGNSIETMLERKEVFSIWDVQDIARQCCQGLDHARVNKVLHYSLEPGKVMVQWDGIVKMLGYGASIMGAFATELCPDIPKVLHYMSPEQTQGNPLEPSSNLFSLGTILYEMVTQQKAFDGQNADQVRHAVLDSLPLSPHEMNSKIDPALSDLIMKAISKEPSERYQSGQELINDLEKCKNNPIKSAPVNKTVQPPAGFKAPQPKPAGTSAAELSKVAAASRPSAPQNTPAIAAIAAAAASHGAADSKALSAIAGAAVGKSGSPTLQSLREAKKIDSSQQFITTCVKASIDAATKTEAKMSTATLEPEVSAPKIAVDPAMAENNGQAKPGRSFSEIDELPPLKAMSAPPPPPSAGADDIFQDDPGEVSFDKSEPAQAALPVRELAKKAVTEIKKTPPKMFLYSIGAAVAIILAIAIVIGLRIRSQNAEDDNGAQKTPVAVSSPTKSGTDDGNSVIRQSTMQLPIAPETQATQNPAVSVREKEKEKSAAKRKSKTAIPQPAAPVIIPAQLMVDSNPEGAQVQVDGRTDPNWITPYNISGLAPGQHTVYMSKTGFAPEIRTIDAISGGKSTVAVRFNQLPATVFFVSAPAGAGIMIDGKDTGRVTPAQISLDKPGSHTFTVKKQGFLEEMTTTTLAPGQTFHYSPTLIALGNTDEIKTVGKLKKLFGNSDPVGSGIVSIKIQPKGSQIAVNGRLLEKVSPVDFYLNPGTYVIDVTLTGYKSVRHVVTVTRGGKITLDETLERE
jgi:serine/threonine protein kinase